MATFTKRKGAWDREFKSATGMAGRYMAQLAIDLMILARRQVGVDTGELRASFTTMTSGGARGPVSKTIANSPHAYLHHEGNGPPGGRIYPKNSKALRFKYKGKIIYAKSVRTHKPNRYLTDNIREVL